MHTAIIKALEERQRQINEEGFGPDHDDEYVDGDLASAASAYAWCTATNSEIHPRWWPWPEQWWKPSEDPQRNIIKAMALLSAEYDRLERAKAAASPAYALEYLYSTDDEWQSGKYDDLHELIVDREREAGDIVYMGTKRNDKAADFTHNASESVIDDMHLQATEEAGEVAEGWPKVSKPHAELLQALIDAWANTYLEPDFYTIADVQGITVTERDVRLANQERN